MTPEQAQYEAEERDDERCERCGDGAYVEVLVDGRLVEEWRCHCTDRAGARS